MEIQTLDLLLNSVYHIIAKMEGGNAMQVFILLNIIWLIAFHFVTGKYNQVLDRVLKIATQQDELLDKISEILKENKLKK